jgi:hypothetical protein
MVHNVTEENKYNFCAVFLNLISSTHRSTSNTFDKHVEIHLNKRKYYIIQKNLKLARKLRCCILRLQNVLDTQDFLFCKLLHKSLLD